MKINTISLLAAISVASVLMTACPQNSDGNSTPTSTLTSIPILPTDGYLTRKEQYLAYCDANSGPGSNNLYGQVCRAYTGTGNYDEARIYASLNKINNRFDCSDFDLNAIVRILYFDRANPTLPDALRNDMKWTVLNFKYWLQEPGPDDMVWWSENHQILFHTVELIAGLLYPDEIFPNSGMTGTEHANHARPMVYEWLNYRAKFGFSEWHSNVYFNEDMPPLVNLVDFADDPEIRTKASMILNVIFFDTASNYYKGLYASPHGRTYPENFVNGLRDSITEAVWIVLGNVPITSINDLGAGNFTGTFVATSDNYIPPPILEDVANDMADSVEHRQRDGIKVEDGPALYGIGYEDYEDIMFWWGMTGYLDPFIINGSFSMIEYYDLWKGNTWKDLTILQPFVGTPVPLYIATDVEAMAGGATLEAMNTYTYRTPYYQLSGAQSYKPFTFSGQVTAWQATIDKDCFVITAFPATFPFGGSFGSDWTGGFIPRATFYKNVGVIQYHKPVLGTLEAFLGAPIDWNTFIPGYTHAYFPKSKFDEYVETTNWFFGRKGESYVALFSFFAPTWKTLDPAEYDLQTMNTDNFYIVEMGDSAHSGTFAQFVADIQASTVQWADTVVYDSPSQGTITVGWNGPMRVNGVDVDLGPYQRWDNPYANQEFGTTITDIIFGDKLLVMDFETPQMLYFSGY